jgi:hypothetical protein
MYRKLVEKIARVVPGAIIECESDVSIVNTVVDTDTSVSDVAQLGSCDGRCVNTRWLLVPVASRTVVYLTVG